MLGEVIRHTKNGAIFLAHPVGKKHTIVVDE